MRTLAVIALVLATLPGCVQLPARVAEVVQQPDPAPRNNFLREPTPTPAWTTANGATAAR